MVQSAVGEHPMLYYIIFEFIVGGADGQRVT